MRNMKLDILISEPWDFTSSDGKNLLNVEIVKKYDSGSMLVKPNSGYQNRSDYLYLEIRNLISGHYNIYAVEGYKEHRNEADIVCNMKFVMIGSIIE